MKIYDEKGRIIQAKSRNKTNGTDIATTQYTFSGQPLVVVQKQEKGGPVNAQVHTVVTKSSYNVLGQVTGITKKINSVIDGVTINKPEVEIVANEFDATGRQLRKSIGKKKDNLGNYTNDVLQELHYEYNIRNMLVGMNRHYLASEGQTTDGTVFGFELGYDRKATSAGVDFNNTEYNGNIAGILWKSDFARCKSQQLSNKMPSDHRKVLIEIVNNTPVKWDLHAESRMKIYSDSLNVLPEGSPLPAFLFNECFDLNRLLWPGLHQPISLRQMVVSKVTNKTVIDKDTEG